MNTDAIIDKLENANDCLCTDPDDLPSANAFMGEARALILSAIRDLEAL